LARYKPTASKANRHTGKIIAIAAIAAIAIGIVIAAASSVIQPPKAPGAIDDNKPMVMHIHPKLSLYVDGKPVPIPANIGIDSNLYKTHKLDAYGMKMPDMPSMPVMYPTHTHDTSGTIHVESNEQRDYTLGDFLDVWGMDFSGKTVKMTVNGSPVPADTDYRSHVFKDGEQIELDVR
jgi:hypothetical protein